MRPENASRRRSTAATVALWTLTILLTLEFFLAGASKFAAGGAGWSANFVRWGLPHWLLPVVGLAEIGSALLLLIPRLATLGAVGLGVVMIGAIGTHATHGEGRRVVFCAILLGLSALVAWMRRAEFNRLWRA
jgi:putative oxidoreductase